MDDCLFCKMVKGEIPCTKLYEDDDMIIIKDINPQPKIHYLMIPKEHYADVTELTDDRAIKLGKMIKKTVEVCNEKLDLKDGFRLVNNKGAFGCQSVKHLHIHILGGEQLEDRMG